MKKERKRLLSAKEAAHFLGISLPTLGRLERRGDLSPYRTPGRHRRYSIEMLEECLEKSRSNRLRGAQKAHKGGLDQ